MCDLSCAYARAQFVAVPWVQNAGNKRIAFTSYCVHPTEYLTDFLSFGSKAVEKSWGAECMGGCGLAI